MKIRPMSVSDVSACVSVHRRAFVDFFLSSLGPRFLRELYRAVVEEPSGIAFVAEEDAGVIGFAAGASQLSSFYRMLLRQRLWRFAFASLGPFLRRPFILGRLLRALRAPRNASRVIGRGTLMSIGILPEAAGRGVGKALVREFVAEASRRGLSQIDLTTDRDRNEPVNRFYQSLGFKRKRTYMTPEGRAMNEYVYDLGTRH